MVWPRFKATPNTFSEASSIRVPRGGGGTTPWPSAARVVQEGEDVSRDPTGNSELSARNRRGSGHMEVLCCLSDL
ncbi:UNVERIFIED_CONTAM: hypothetical protein PYX00_004047 [Menopon gallinae]|uniref:Uncharacterized protein n=1 Tax=Menopon gallinae TaxID=328185 RepID=A0AAW2I2S7_9NEOP